MSVRPYSQDPTIFKSPISTKHPVIVRIKNWRGFKLYLEIYFRLILGIKVYLTVKESPSYSAYLLA